MFVRRLKNNFSILFHNTPGRIYFSFIWSFPLSDLQKKQAVEYLEKITLKNKSY